MARNQVMRVELDLWYDFGGMVKSTPFKATLVDVLPAHTEIPSDTVRAYYGAPAGEPPPKHCFNVFVIPRNVYLKDTGGYVVLPMTERNKRCIKELDE